MELAFAVQHANPFDELPEDMPDALGPADSRRRRPADVFDEIDAVHQLHREEAIRAFHDELVQRHEIRMRHIRQAAKLAFEPIDVARAHPKQRFQRDDFPADAVVHFVDDPHPARAQPPLHGEPFGPLELRTRSKGGQRLNRGAIVSRGQDAECIHDSRFFEESARALVCEHEPIELAPQAVIAGAGLGEEGRTCIGCARDGRFE